MRLSFEIWQEIPYFFDIFDLIEICYFFEICSFQSFW